MIYRDITIEVSVYITNIAYMNLDDNGNITCIYCSPMDIDAVHLYIDEYLRRKNHVAGFKKRLKDLLDV